MILRNGHSTQLSLPGLMWNTEGNQRKAQNHHNLSSCKENQHAKPYQTPSKYLNQQPELRNNPITVNTAPDDLKNRKTCVPESSFLNADYQPVLLLINLNIPILMSVRQQSHPCFSRPLFRINTAVSKIMKIYQFYYRDVNVKKLFSRQILFFKILLIISSLEWKDGRKLYWIILSSCWQMSIDLTH